MARVMAASRKGATSSGRFGRVGHPERLGHVLRHPAPGIGVDRHDQPLPVRQGARSMAASTPSNGQVSTGSSGEASILRNRRVLTGIPPAARSSPIRGSRLSKDPVRAELAPTHGWYRVALRVGDRDPLPGGPSVWATKTPRHLEHPGRVDDGLVLRPNSRRALITSAAHLLSSLVTG